MKARLENNIVVEILNSDNLENNYHPDLIFKPCQKPVDVGWLWNGTDFTPPDSAPAPSKQALFDYLSQKKWEIETGGIVVGDIAVPTTDRAKILIMGAAQTLQDTDQIDFETPRGWIKISGTQVRQIQNAILSHVQATFLHKKTIYEKIQTGAITDFLEINVSRWPGV